MISLAPSLWYERRGICPHCGKPVRVDEIEKCRACGVVLSAADREQVVSSANRLFFKTGLIGGILLIVLISAVIAVVN